VFDPHLISIQIMYFCFLLAQ